MAEGAKRSLRMRRPPQYFVEGEDADNLGYGRTTHAKEYLSPAQEINSMAKLISKFVNSANKHLRDSADPNSASDKNQGPAHEPPVEKQPKKTELGIEALKKKPIPKPEAKPDKNKQAKELYNYKEQVNKPAQSKQKNPYEQLAGRENPGMGIPAYMRNPSQFLNMQYMHVFGQMTGQQRMAAMSQQLSLTATQQAVLQQQQMLMNANPMFRQQIMVQEPLVPKNFEQKEKLFGRAAYHLAIAYHIHLKNIKESGVDAATQNYMLDPTYPAKKLRGDCHDRPN